MKKRHWVLLLFLLLMTAALFYTALIDLPASSPVYPTEHPLSYGLVGFIIGSFYILAGLYAIYPYIKLRQPYLLSLVAFSGCFGLYTILRTNLLLPAADHGAFWTLLELAALIAAAAAVTAFVRQLFEGVFAGWLQYLWAIHLGYGAATLPLVAAAVVQAGSVMRLYQILLLATVAVVLFIIGKAAIGGDPEARTVAPGLFIFGAAVVADSSRHIFTGGNGYYAVSYWGGLALLFTLSMIIVNRIDNYLLRPPEREKLSDAEQIAAGVAHEIRNPITVISGYLQLMKKNPAYHKPMIELLLSEVNRIQLLVNEFLFLSKPPPPNFSQQSIVDIIKYVLRLFEAQIEEAAIKTDFVYPDKLPEIPIDENQIKQVMVNIIKNGIEAMSEKSGVLTVRVEKRGNYAVVSITDTGYGIEHSHLSKIGEPFFSTKQNGVGLGVTTCKRIVENHNGRFQIFSTQGAGTKVDILLPLTRRS